MLNPLLNFIQDLRHPKDVYGCFRLLFVVVLMFGVTPFCIDSTGRKPGLKASTVGYLNICVRIGVFIVCFSYSFLYERSVISFFFQTPLSNFTDSLQKFNGAMGLTSVLFMSLLRRHYLQRLIESFYNLEKRFLNVGVAFRQMASAIRVNFVVVLFVLLNSIFVCCSLFGILKRNGVQVSIPTAISFYSPNFILCATIILHRGTFYKILAYLRALNKVLKNLGQQWDNESKKPALTKKRKSQWLNSFTMYKIVTKSSSEIIKESMEIQQLICEAAATANKYFTCQLLIVISIAFLIVVFDAYYVLETILGKSNQESKFQTLEFLAFFLCQMLLYSFGIISIVESCDCVIKKSKKTGGIVHTLLNKASDLRVQEKLQQFSLQLLHQKINFTANGLFNINRTLYFTISGALTTYLIILLQFTKSESEILSPMDRLAMISCSMNSSHE